MNGTVQTPIEGVSMLYTFADAKAPSTHTTQYFEIFGNRAIYQRRLAGRHGPSRCVGIQTPRRRSRTTYGSCTTRGRTSAWRMTWPRRIPTKLKEMQDLFMKEAVKYHVLPIDDRGLERIERGHGRAA